jgi:hypothetical protein
MDTHDQPTPEETPDQPTLIRIAAALGLTPTWMPDRWEAEQDGRLYDTEEVLQRLRTQVRDLWDAGLTLVAISAGLDLPPDLVRSSGAEPWMVELELLRVEVHVLRAAASHDEHAMGLLAQHASALSFELRAQVDRDAVTAAIRADLEHLAAQVADLQDGVWTVVDAGELTIYRTHARAVRARRQIAGQARRAGTPSELIARTVEVRRLPWSD